jgi:hypothetical protein
MRANTYVLLGVPEKKPLADILQELVAGLNLAKGDADKPADDAKADAADDLGDMPESIDFAATDDQEKRADDAADQPDSADETLSISYHKPLNYYDRRKRQIRNFIAHDHWARIRWRKTVSFSALIALIAPAQKTLRGTEILFALIAFSARANRQTPKQGNGSILIPVQGKRLDKRTEDRSRQHLTLVVEGIWVTKRKQIQ